MEVEEAIRTRRTHKAYRRLPVDRATLDQLFELARWAPNHHLTNPWRFRVIGPRALERLKLAAGPEAAAKLDRAPTLVVCSCALAGDRRQRLSPGEHRLLQVLDHGADRLAIGRRPALDRLTEMD